MKLNNETLYDTRKLRSIITAVFRRFEKIEGKGSYPWGMLKVDVVYGRGLGTVAGEAFVKGIYMRLFLGRCRADTRWLAHIIEHELEHCYGYGHRQMARVTQKTWDVGYSKHYDWAAEKYGEEFLPELPKPKTGPVVSLQEQRYQRLCERERKWEPKLRRAKNALTKIRRQKKYYEKALAAKGKEGKRGKA